MDIKIRLAIEPKVRETLLLTIVKIKNNDFFVLIIIGKSLTKGIYTHSFSLLPQTYRLIKLLGYGLFFFWGNKNSLILQFVKSFLKTRTKVVHKKVSQG